MNREELNSLSVYTLRGMGRKIGVKKPTALKKGDLIQEILDIKCGKKQPYFTNMGRRTKDYEIGDIEKVIKEREEQIEKLKFKKRDKEKLLLRIFEVKQQIDCLLNDLIDEINLKETEE